MGIRVKAGSACPNAGCEEHGSLECGNLVLQGYSKVKWGRRRRYRCTACGKIFGATTGTPYKRLQRPMSQFDRVAALRVEDMSKAAIARIEGLCWNTVSRWLELAAAMARRFNNAKTRGYALEELQLDELNTFLGSHKQQTWVYAGIEVSSRLWPATLVGPRTWANTKAFIRSIADSSEWAPFSLKNRGSCLSSALHRSRAALRWPRNREHPSSASASRWHVCRAARS